MNRRYDQGGARSVSFWTAIKLVAVIIGVTLVALGMLMQNKTNKQLSAELAKREKRFDLLVKEVKCKQAQVAELKSPRVLARRVQQMGLKLVEIQASQIVPLYTQGAGAKERVARLASAEQSKEAR